jgi:periplasmic copper chaperone A
MNLKPFLALLAALTCSPSLADSVKVDNAWARATAPGQPVAGAFMELAADSDLTLVSASSPAAQRVELHTMAMDQGVMVMRQVKHIDLPKGHSVKLQPGGLHLMLIDLNTPLKAGQPTQVTLTVKNRKGKTSKVVVEVPVRAMADDASAHHHH